jgi:flagellar biosynthesis protein FlhG
MSKTVTIASGKGGVGKTNISLNLALYLSKQGYRVCLFDGDFGLANINILLGLQPEYDLKDVIFDGKKLKNILIRLNENIDILPGSSGVEAMANLESDRMRNLIDSFSEMAEYDFLLFDTSAGISRNVISFCLASSDVLIIMTPEPTSLIDSYALLKIMILNEFKGEAKLVLNQCKNSTVAKVAYEKFKSAAAEHLGVEIKLLDTIYHDDKLIEAVQQQSPMLSLYPNSNFSRGIKKVGEHFVSAAADHFEEADMAGFWKHCLKVVKSPLKLPSKKNETEKEPSRVKCREDQKKIQQAAKCLPEKETEVESTANSRLNSKKDEIECRGCSPKNEEVMPCVQPGEGGMRVDKPLMLNIEKLIQSISSVSEEIRFIREVIQKNMIVTPETRSPGIPMINHLVSRPIRLDLETYLNSRACKTKGP